MKAQDNIQVWRFSELPGVELSRGKEVVHAYPPHWHEELLVCAMDKIGGVLTLRGVHHTTYPGCVFVVGPGEVHANWTRVPAGCGYRSLYIRVEDNETWHRRKLLAEPVRDDSRARSMLAGVHRGLTPLAREVALAELLAHLQGSGRTDQQDTASGPGRSPSCGLTNAREYLEKRYAASVTLDDRARVAYLSRFFFFVS